MCYHIKVWRCGFFIKKFILHFLPFRQPEIWFCVPADRKADVIKKPCEGLFPLKKKHLHRFINPCITDSKLIFRKHLFFLFVFGKIYSMSPPERKTKDQKTLCRFVFLFKIMCIHFWNFQCPLSIVLMLVNKFAKQTSYKWWTKTAQGIKKIYDVKRGKLSTLNCPLPDFQYRFQAIRLKGVG